MESFNPLLYLLFIAYQWGTETVFFTPFWSLLEWNTGNWIPLWPENCKKNDALLRHFNRANFCCCYRAVVMVYIILRIYLFIYKPFISSGFSGICVKCIIKLLAVWSVFHILRIIWVVMHRCLFLLRIITVVLCFFFLLFHLDCGRGTSQAHLFSVFLLNLI